MLEKNSMCKVVELGTIKLKMFDEMIRELNNVRHMPDLKRNSIYLGVLKQIGCVINVESGIMEVIKGLIVVINGNKQNGLFVLQGTTAFSDVSVSTSQSLDKTFIWHLRLGYMSKKCLKTLES